MDGIEIEAFVAGTKASKGLTADHIAEAASLYDAEKAPAPLVFGHPASDSPALGVVAKARAEGSKLFLTLNNIADAVVQGVKERRILGRSIAFWDPHHPSNPNPGKYSIRHLGLLGGQAPAIPGMPALKFSADDSALESEEAPADAIIFAFEETPTNVQTITETAPAQEPKMTEAEIQAAADANKAEAQRLADQKAAQDKRDQEFAASEQTRREGENAATVDKAVAAGAILPAEADDLKKIFNALPTTALTFAAGELEPRSALAAFIGKLPKRAPIQEQRQSPTGEFSANDDAKAAADAALASANKGLADGWKTPALAN